MTDERIRRMGLRVKIRLLQRLIDNPKYAQNRAYYQEALIEALIEYGLIEWMTNHPSERPNCWGIKSTRVT